jgi:hypothetical protein
MKENGAVTAREPNRPDDAWVVDVLHAEQLELIDERRIQHYGKRALSRSTNLVLWALRSYVVLMMLIIVVQLWIGFHQ